MAWDEALTPDTYWREWTRQALVGRPGAYSELEELPEAERPKWVMRLSRPVSPLLPVILDWWRPLAEGWTVVPGLRWDRAATARGSFLCYPEALGSHALALLGLGWCAVQGAPSQERAAAQRLGALLAPMAHVAGLPVRASILAGYYEAYAEHLTDSGWELIRAWAAGVDAVPEAMDWPDWPEASAAYREQLQWGIVPHESGGGAPLSPESVLLAWIGSAQPRQSLSLVGKAIESWHIERRWRESQQGQEGER